MRKYILIFLFCLSALYQVDAQIPSYVFHSLSIKDGLSEATVRSIMEDRKGFMWFGTEDGLNKYDGYIFTVYKNTVNDSFSISSNNIKCIYTDSKGNLWIGTRHGLNLYDPLLDRYYNFNNAEYPALKYIKGDIEVVIEDKKGCLWALSSTDGLFRISSLQDKPERFHYRVDDNIKEFVSIDVDQNNNFLIGTQAGLLSFDTHTNSFTDLRSQYGMLHVRDIYIDTDQSIWLATTVGLKLIDPHTRTMKSLTHSALDPKTLNGNNTVRILPYKNYLMVAIDSDGLDLYDKETGIFHHYTKQSGAQLSTNNITAVYMDSKGTLWTGSFLNGVNFSNSATNFFVYVKNNSSKSSSVTSGVVTSFLKDSRNDFWITTDGGGVYLKKNNTQSFINYTAFDPHPIILANAAVGSIEDEDGNVWISTYNGGITRITPDGKSTIFKNDPLNNKSLGFNKSKGLCAYNHEIWVSTFGMGLSVFDKKTETFRHYRNNPNDPKSIPSEWSYWFLKDSRNNLWIATFAGLSRYLPEENSFKTYKLDNGKVPTDKNYVFDILEDSKNRLWLGTNGGGLVLFDRDNESFTFYTIENGLSDNTVKSVIEDNNGVLWLATNNGITQFNAETGKAIAYTIKDGLPAGSFYYNAHYKDEQGKIYFGMNEGYLTINPTLTNEAFDFPKVVLTEFRIFNIPVRPTTDNSPLDKSITEATSITLPYDQNSISIQFAALNFTIPRHNYYSYQLEGFEKEWNNAGKNREAKYTNLDPGTYTLKVRASNNEKTFGETYTSFTIIITPPFWETWWFRTLVGILIVSGIVGFFYLRTENIRRRNKRLSDEVRERTKELEGANESLQKKNEVILIQQKELLDKKYTLEKNNDKLSEWNTFQQKLIGIIGHDIRGPLQRFSSLLKVMDEDSKDFVFEKLNESAASLSILATDLLSWVSTQSHKGESEIVSFSWKEVFEKTVKEIEPFKIEKGITIVIKGTNHDMQVNGIFQIALSALRNVLYNAIRFSKAGGIIEIEYDVYKDGLCGMRITDHGAGFDSVDVNKLISGEGFKGMKSSGLQEGAGLGMSICYDMIKRLGGLIEAATLPDTGGTFYIYLPLADETNIVTSNMVEPAVNTDPQTSKSNSLKNKKILLVDDDDEIRWSLRKALEEFVEVYEARSAEEALKWLEDNTPDMAVLDIVMDGMSGLELCKRIKHSKTTAHVPCMIISGETGPTIRTEVFNAGADTFLPKPFTVEEILIQVNTFFENQDKQLKRFFTENIPVDELTSNEINKDFLKRLVEVIEKNLASPDLSVDYLATEIGMSKSTLYRNLKSITGQSANVFIKNIRMRRSLILLKEGKLNISEIATEVGFNSASYFTTTFKKHFGFSPNELK